jgi:RHS repeat-associated protein
VTDALGNSTSYTYDAVGNLLTQTDGNGNTTTYTYNRANLVISKTDPAGYAESYTYYANGKIKEKTDRNGIGTYYNYDIFGRLLTEDAGGQVQSYTYDANGNLLTMTDGTGTTTRTYDALNRNISKDVPAIGNSIYEYDLATDHTGEYAESTTDPKGNVTLKTYDRVGRLSKVTTGGRTTQYVYYNNGNRRSVRYQDGTTEAYTYDKNNRITGLTNTKVNGSVISSYQYTYDATGNQLTKTESKGTTTYTYDGNNRLSTVTETEGKVISYTYDAAGNRRSEQVEYGLVSSATVYSYDECGRLTTTISSDGTETRYLYDPNGNLASKSVRKMEIVSPEELSEEMLPEFDLIINKGDAGGTGTDKLTIYSYDNYNRLARLKSGNSTANYGYNAQGYRVEKKVNSKTTRYLYEYDKVVLETNDSNNQTAVQVYGTNLLYRSTTGEAGKGTQSYYYLYNAHGDVTSLLDMSGSIAVSYDYDAFGEIKGQTGTADNPIRYAGYQYDEESGLYYLNARYYDSVTARFITEDSYTGERNDPLSLNLYTYCSNNPIMYIDPSGHKKETSIVDYLKSQGENSSFSARKEIAKNLGIKNYKGTDAQNTQMLKTLQAQESKESKQKAVTPTKTTKQEKDKSQPSKKTNDVSGTIYNVSFDKPEIINAQSWGMGNVSVQNSKLVASAIPIPYNPSLPIPYIPDLGGYSVEDVLIGIRDILLGSIGMKWSDEDSKADTPATAPHPTPCLQKPMERVILQ